MTPDTKQSETVTSPEEGCSPLVPKANEDHKVRWVSDLQEDLWESVLLEVKKARSPGIGPRLAATADVPRLDAAPDLHSSDNSDSDFYTPRSHVSNDNLEKESNQDHSDLEKATEKLDSDSFSSIIDSESTSAVSVIDSASDSATDSTPGPGPDESFNEDGFSASDLSSLMTKLLQLELEGDNLSTPKTSSIDKVDFSVSNTDSTPGPGPDESFDVSQAINDLFRLEADTLPESTLKESSINTITVGFLASNTNTESTPSTGTDKSGSNGDDELSFALPDLILLDLEGSGVRMPRHKFN
jgi:hypothetical protein